VATSLIFIVAVFGETLAGNVTCKVKKFFMFVTRYCYHCGGGNCSLIAHSFATSWLKGACLHILSKKKIQLESYLFQ